MPTLTEAHRLAQSRLGAQTVRVMRAAWPVLNVDDLDGTFEDWLRIVTPLVQGQRRHSATLAANYFAALRSAELGVSSSRTVAPVLSDLVDVPKLATSMLVTGPVSIRSALGRGVKVEVATDIAEARSSASALRHALDGGRETIIETVKADKRAVGWARVASGRACDFCSLLEGRGVVYSEDSVSFEAHDGCQCSAEPAFD